MSKISNLARQGTEKSTALLSIQPRFADLIIEGKKTVEFRRVRFKHQILHVVIYATKPVQRVIGYFEVTTIEEEPPEVLWKRYNKVSGLGKEEFLSYFQSSETGIAIKIGKVQALVDPVPLSNLGNDITPPQSFTYLSSDEFEHIRIA